MYIISHVFWRSVIYNDTGLRNVLLFAKTRGLKFFFTSLFGYPWTIWMHSSCDSLWKYALQNYLRQEWTVLDNNYQSLSMCCRRPNWVRQGERESFFPLTVIRLFRAEYRDRRIAIFTVKFLFFLILQGEPSWSECGKEAKIYGNRSRKGFFFRTPGVARELCNRWPYHYDRQPSFGLFTEKLCFRLMSVNNVSKTNNV